MELAALLHEQARRDNHRRLLVLSGSQSNTRQAAREALAATGIPIAKTSAVGPSEQFDCESLDYHETDKLLGTSREAIVYDAHDRFEPNTLGKLVGAVEGGGLFLLLTPPLDDWPGHSDEFRASLAPPPFSTDAVGTNFRTRLIEMLRAHRGIAIVDVDTGTVECDGLIDSAIRAVRPSKPRVESGQKFPRAAYEACLTGDQAQALRTLEALREDSVVVIESNRGRGKSSAAGLAAASLVSDGLDVLVTAPDPGNVTALFERATELLDALDIESTVTTGEHWSISTPAGEITYVRPAAASERVTENTVLIVDEAAAVPVHLLETYLTADRVAFTTTIHGYEGAGRGFSVRFRQQLGDSVIDYTLTEPIRYDPGDPIEVWALRALALDARPAVDQLVAGSTPKEASYQTVSGETLTAREPLLQELFGLLVLAHYRTEPNDLARLLDAPNVSVRCLTVDGHVAAVALLSREGGLSEEQRRSMYEGKRISGNLLPDILTSQLRDEAAGKTVGYRVLRIATHPALRSSGFGSHLLDAIRAEFEEEVDWLGVAYGGTPRLVRFWARNGYRTVHLATTPNSRSGEHSVLMLDPASESGEKLLDRHTDWFLRRTPAAIRESLSGVDPAMIAGAFEATAGTPELSLSEMEWRHLAGVGTGAAIFETAPRATRRLAVYHLCVGETSLSPTAQTVLIRKAIQGQPAENIVSEEAVQSERECMQTLGDAVTRLLEQYGTPAARNEVRRLE